MFQSQCRQNSTGTAVARSRSLRKSRVPDDKLASSVAPEFEQSSLSAPITARLVGRHTRKLTLPKSCRTALPAVEVSLLSMCSQYPAVHCVLHRGPARLRLHDDRSLYDCLASIIFRVSSSPIFPRLNWLAVPGTDDAHNRESRHWSQSQRTNSFRREKMGAHWRVLVVPQIRI